ncbi:MAG TPA: cupredoxin domain-containing protein [Sphingomicrobium sp.]|nr:cupredoxin domain-containing protein [Sphingomicrobium sp.]
MRPTLLLAAAALLAAGPAAAQPVQTVTLYSHGYAPTVLRLAAGQPVTLVFVNQAGKSHDFTARRFFHSAQILSGRVYGGEVNLRGGQSARVTLIPRAGRYPVHCGYPFHKMLGMRGTIIVQ